MADFTFSLVFPTEPENIRSVIQVYTSIKPVGRRELDLVKVLGFHIPGLKIDRCN